MKNNWINWGRVSNIDGRTFITTPSGECLSMFDNTPSLYETNQGTFEVVISAIRKAKGA